MNAKLTPKEFATSQEVQLRVSLRWLRLRREIKSKVAMTERDGSVQAQSMSLVGHL